MPTGYLVVAHRRYSWDEITQMSYEQLTELLNTVTDLEEDIGAQVREAKGDYAEHGKRADWTWMKKAERAKRSLGRARPRIAAIRRTKRPAYMEAVRFKEIAKEVLKPETYALILEEARKEPGHPSDESV